MSTLQRLALSSTGPLQFMFPRHTRDCAKPGVKNETLGFVLPNTGLDPSAHDEGMVDAFEA